MRVPFDDSAFSVFKEGVCHDLSADLHRFEVPELDKTFVGGHQLSVLLTLQSLQVFPDNAVDARGALAAVKDGSDGDAYLLNLDLLLRVSIRGALFSVCIHPGRR